MTFTLLIYRTAAASEPISKARDRAAMTGHRSLQAEAAARGELHAVARLDDIDSARTVRVKGGAHDVTDGPFIETKEWLVGFYLIDCETIEQAVDRAKRLCPDDSHAIEVRPVTWRHEP